MKLRLIICALVSVVGLLVGSQPALAGPTSQEFLLNTPNGSEKTTVIAVGVFNGVGEDVAISEREKEGPNGRFTFVARDKFVFGEGSLFVRIEGAGRVRFNEETCAGRGSGRASYRFTGGTQLFRNARGAGTATFDFAFVGDKVNGECAEHGGSGVFFAELKGTLRLRGGIAT